MSKFFQIIVFLIVGLFACNTSTEKDANGSGNKNQDIAFIDTSNLQAYVLYDGRYILSISIIDNHGKKIPVTRFGIYTKKGDTIFADCSKLSEDAYRKIKTKYFWIEMHSGEVNNGEKFVPADSLYSEVFYKDPVLLADSLFGTKFYGSKLLDDSTILVYLPFAKETLLIKGDKIATVRIK